jgi:hypothetical protein
LYGEQNDDIKVLVDALPFNAFLEQLDMSGNKAMGMEGLRTLFSGYVSMKIRTVTS